MRKLVIERENLVKMMDEWLQKLRVDQGDKLEVTFQADEMVIHPQSVNMADLDAWLDEATLKYDSVLKRLAAS